LRIQSTFKDFYDTAQAFSQEFDFKYLRYEKETKLPNFPLWEEFNERKRKALGWRVYRMKEFAPYLSGFVGFCGKIYPLIHCTIPKKKDKWGYPEVLSASEERKLIVFCYNLAHLDKFVNQHFANTEDHTNYFTHHNKGWAAAFALMQERMDSCAELFVTHNCPIFLVSKSYDGFGRQSKENEVTFTTNIALGGLQFQKMFDAYQAYQEIMMFMGNLATPQKPIPMPDNTTKIALAGFTKESFRKEKRKR
jgi:hypothetical protein